MNLKFDNMSFYYPPIYLTYQAFFILAIAIFDHLSFDIYLVLGAQVLYLIFLMVSRPYNTLRNFNKFMHNITIIINQLTTIIVVAIVIRWNTIYGTDSQIDSHTETSIYFFIILTLLVITLTLAIIRLAIFNKDVNFKCNKK
jgi:hypothetical protein